MPKVQNESEASKAAEDAYQSILLRQTPGRNREGSQSRGLGSRS